MFDPVILFSTLTLAILIGAAYWLDIPKMAVPLAVVYVIFLFFSLSEQKEPSPMSPQNNPPQHQPVKITPVIDEPIKAEKPLDVVDSIQPKPLTFTDNDPTFIDAKQEQIQEIEATNEDLVEEEPLLEVRSISICQNIQNRTPIQKGTTFKAGVDSLFCFTLLSNTGGKQRLTHIWEYNGKVMSRIQYSVKHSNSWRSWTRKTILGHQVGPWKVSVEDASGHILKSIEFEIVKGS